MSKVTWPTTPTEGDAESMKYTDNFKRARIGSAAMGACGACGLVLRSAMGGPKECSNCMKRKTVP